MSNIIFNSPSDWVAAMKYAASLRTRYNNTYPYNVMYFDGATLTADCVNFDKSLFNGRDVYHMTAGSCQRDLSNTGDCTEAGLINQCADVSSDFSRLKAGEPRVLYMDGHIGNYIGEEVNINGNLYNVIECTGWTGDFGHDGIIYSWVDSDGTRRTHRGGGASMRWTKHGLPNKWVNFNGVQPQPTPTPTPVSTDVNVYYRVKTKDHGWLPEVKNLEDYAGWQGSPIIAFMVRVDKGSVWYQAHAGGRWLGQITGYDTEDFDYGYAGDNENPIDALKIYYTTPSDIVATSGYKKAKYKVNNYDWQYDDEVEEGVQDGYAGEIGVPATELRVVIE